MKTKITSSHWKSHIRQLFDEILINDEMRFMRPPLQITLQIIGEAAKYAAETQDEKMIGYFCRLGIYSFSDPTDRDYDQKRTEYYLSKI